MSNMLVLTLTYKQITKKMHAEMDYAPIWLQLYESLIKYHKITLSTEYPCMVEHRYIMNPSPIPKFDNDKLRFNRINT